jgi:nicotinamidase-related amidase
LVLHRWRIEEREYRRHEQRRARRHAYERLEPAATALVVVDMVPFFVAENPYCKGVVRVIDDLARIVRAAHGTVAWVVPAKWEPTDLAVEFHGEQAAAAYGASGGDGEPRLRLWPEFKVGSGDLVVEKSAASAFFPGRCELHDRLVERGVRTVLVVGTVANVCCESTARDAATLGYRVVMVADANAARSDEDLNATLRTVYRSFGDVRPSSEITTLLAAGRK